MNYSHFEVNNARVIVDTPNSLVITIVVLDKNSNILLNLQSTRGMTQSMLTGTWDVMSGRQEENVR